MWNPFRKIKHPDGDVGYYTPGYVFDGGSEHLAYRNDHPHPLITQFGGFVPKRNIQVTERQVVYQSFASPLQPIIPGFVAGQLTTAALTDASSFSGSANNQLIASSLFGGVQS